jgi:hypothetical protein
LGLHRRSTPRYLLGVPFDRIELVQPDEVRSDGDRAGCVVGSTEAIRDVCEAQREAVILLSGEAAFRVAWASGALSDEQIGGARRELSDGEALVAAKADTPAQRATLLGWYSRAEHSDERHVREIAEWFSSSPLEAAALTNYLQLRTTAFVQTERFQRLHRALAEVLLEMNGRVLDGEAAWRGLESVDALKEEAIPA